MKTKQSFELIPSIASVTQDQIPTKTEMDELANSITQQVMDGHYLAIDVHMRCKAIMKILETILADTEQAVIEEIITRGHNNELEFSTATAKLREGFNTPNYESDPMYCELKAKVKEREELLKLAFKNPSVQITDTDGGEIVPVLPPKITKQSIAITFKK